MTPDLMARLAQHRTLGSAPAAEHAWLVANGTLTTLATGDILVHKGDPSPSLWVLLAGSLAIYLDRGAGSHTLVEWKAGDVTGSLPYSRGAAALGDVLAQEPAEVLAIPRGCFTELIHECPAITAILVHAMIDRARLFKTGDLRDEKLVSLGKLAAGLAHELNNPAAAAVRSAKLLAQGIAASEAAAARLGAARLSDGQLAAIDAVRERCGRVRAPESISAVARADREDALAGWLAEHGADDECAGPLTEAGVTPDALDTLAASVQGEALHAALKWIAAGCLARGLSGEIETAVSRIYDLVGAVKGFTYMDHAPTPGPVDVRRGITDTLTMLGAKTRAKAVEVTTRFADELPPAHAVGAELNQVWMNLVDNALDAVPEGGHVEVTAGAEQGRVVVRIIDDGPGIPADIQGRIFDPFFTTKGVGKGTGLGLDIVRRLMQAHEGDVEVESVPGRTEFRVRVPMER
jgi:signal transduction histidine kinase